MGVRATDGTHTMYKSTHGPTLVEEGNNICEVALVAASLAVPTAVEHLETDDTSLRMDTAAVRRAVVKGSPPTLSGLRLFRATLGASALGRDPKRVLVWAQCVNARSNPADPPLRACENLQTGKLAASRDVPAKKFAREA